MSSNHILLILADSTVSQQLTEEIFAPAGSRVTRLPDWGMVERFIRDDPPQLAIVSDKIEGQDALILAANLAQNNPLIPVILLPEVHSEQLLRTALHLGFAGYLERPLLADKVQEAIRLALQRRHNWQAHERKSIQQNRQSLQKKFADLDAIAQIGRKVTAALDLDSVLTNIVEAAVNLSGAEEGSLLLPDEETGELYIRASRNFQDDFVKTFRLPIRDSLVWQVLRSGQPLVIDEKKPKKIKTAYLVHSLVYVPIMQKERVIGVLEIDNRKGGKSFTDYHITLLKALADYAAIALENTRLYTQSENECKKLQTILTDIGDGVIVVDNDRRMILMNPKARQAFDVTDENLIGKRARDVIQHPEMVDFLRNANVSVSSRTELSLQDGRVMNAQITPIPDIGLVVTLQDITHLKELDRIKTDFVNTISHDLRSPLTAILGYVELIERVGEVTDQQREFIRRVQLSVQSITELMNDLLDLGRIEAGFDTHKEVVHLATIVHYAVDSLRNRSAAKSQQMIVNLPETNQSVLGNPVRLRQMVTHLLINAINYSGEGAVIDVSGQAEAEQIILQIQDNGPGIPPADLPYIFDKFYRASNTPMDIPGSGLGLAIVKSIVDDHLGRIWVASPHGQGVTFTIVLPLISQEL